MSEKDIKVHRREHHQVISTFKYSFPKKDVIKKTHLSHAFIDYLLRETPKKKVPKNIDLYDRMDKQFGMHNFRGWEGLKINYVKNELDELDELSML